MITKNLKEKHIVIIGGSSGIGRAVAEIAYQLEAKVTLTGQTAKKAERVAETIGKSVSAAQLNVNDEKQVNAFFEKCADIDHIYIAAGSTKLGSVLGGTLDENLAAFNTRLVGSLRIVRASVHKINQGGSFTFTGGVSSDRPIAGAWVSGLATASAEQLARVLVMEFPNVRFNAIAPGYTDTPMWDTIIGVNKQTVLAGIAEKLPARKIATPEEVASAIILMMANPSITGEIIHVDGGARLV